MMMSLLVMEGVRASICWDRVDGVGVVDRLMMSMGVFMGLLGCEIVI
jgi:hypothetical protein